MVDHSNKPLKNEVKKEDSLFNPRSYPKTLCPACHKRGVSRWKHTEFGATRSCRYCHHCWGKREWKSVSNNE